MELTVLNTDLDAIEVVDVYESFIWTDRYHEYGDFELYTMMENNVLNYIKKNYYLTNRDSEHAMIIEDWIIKSDSEDGNHITVTGRSLESILTRRIIWGQKTISGNLQEGIKVLLDECIIRPTDEKRKIPNFIFEYSDDEAITALKIDAQYTGDNLYDVIKSICEERGIGFKVTINDSKQFVFKLYAGVDRSYDQTVVPYVVFSPSFDNIINSNYMESNSNLKNITLVAGEGEGSARKYTTVGNTSVSGLDRRELFTDARDISSQVDGGTISDAAYTAQLAQRGKERLAENTETSSFEGQTETTIMYRYREHFFDGDIVQIENEYGHETKARILEVVMSEDETGASVYPTFKTLL